ncbi:hypothetical protein L1887_08341 [Cichorium endivia]|nr:hypothetical protein L1887_08341 [Cichorium endivia]
MKAPTIVCLVCNDDAYGSSGPNPLNSCSDMELMPCGVAISSSQAPTSDCCTKVTQQSPCFCGYIRDPSYRQFISLATTERVVRQCSARNYVFPLSSSNLIS